eukprot:5328986-Pleurochrysis_carterae.AAC.1
MALALSFEEAAARERREGKRPMAAVGAGSWPSSGTLAGELRRSGGGDGGRGLDSGARGKDSDRGADSDGAAGGAAAGDDGCGKRCRSDGASCGNSEGCSASLHDDGKLSQTSSIVAKAHHGVSSAGAVLPSQHSVTRESSSNVPTEEIDISFDLDDDDDDDDDDDALFTKDMFAPAGGGGDIHTGGSHAGCGGAANAVGAAAAADEDDDGDDDDDDGAAEDDGDVDAEVRVSAGAGSASVDAFASECAHSGVSAAGPCAGSAPRAGESSSAASQVKTASWRMDAKKRLWRTLKAGGERVASSGASTGAVSSSSAATGCVAANRTGFVAAAGDLSVFVPAATVMGKVRETSSPLPGDQRVSVEKGREGVIPSGQMKAGSQIKADPLPAEVVDLDVKVAKLVNVARQAECADVDAATVRPAEQIRQTAFGDQELKEGAAQRIAEVDEKNVANEVAPSRPVATLSGRLGKDSQAEQQGVKEDSDAGVASSAFAASGLDSDLPRVHIAQGRILERVASENEVTELGDSAEEVPKHSTLNSSDLPTSEPEPVVTMSAAERQRLLGEVEKEATALGEAQRKQKRDVETVTEDMLAESKRLLSLF